MKILSKLFLTVGVVALVAALTPPAQADVGIQSFGITNASLADSAGASALGVSEVRVEGQDNISLIFKGNCNATNVSSSTFKFTFARVDGNGNQETSPLLTWSPPPGISSSNAIVLWTNLPQAAIGSARGLVLVNMTNVSGGATFSPTLYLQKKNLRPGK